jgi:hypothetical protein
MDLELVVVVGGGGGGDCGIDKIWALIQIMCE